MKNKRQIKIKKEYWYDIVNGIKKREIRKLSKGIVSGTYEFVSIEQKQIRGYNEYSEEPIEIYGTARLDVLDAYGKNEHFSFKSSHKPTADFVKENYLNKHDFVVYGITEVKENYDE